MLLNFGNSAYALVVLCLYGESKSPIRVVVAAVDEAPLVGAGVLAAAAEDSASGLDIVFFYRARAGLITCENILFSYRTRCILYNYLPVKIY